MTQKPNEKIPVGLRLSLARAEAKKRGVKFGMQKGMKTAKVWKRENKEKAINQIIMNKAESIVRASIIPALGMTFVYRIDEEINEKGKVTMRKHILVEDPDEIAEALDQMEEGGQHPEDKFYYVTAKAPEYKAGESLLNRWLGKPKETLGVEVEHKFSLKDLGKKADELEKKKYREVGYTQVDKVDNLPPA